MFDRDENVPMHLSTRLNKISTYLLHVAFLNITTHYVIGVRVRLVFVHRLPAFRQPVRIDPIQNNV